MRKLFSIIAIICLGVVSCTATHEDENKDKTETGNYPTDTPPKDDGGDDNNNNNNSKEIRGILSRIIKESSLEDSEDIVISLQYDNAGRLTKFVYGDEHLHDFTYSESRIVCSDLVCELIDSKIATVTAGDWLFMSYAYDSHGYISEIKEEYTMVHTWEDGNIVKLSAKEVPSYYCTATYDNIENNINFDLNRIVTMSNTSAYTTVRGGDTEYMTLCLYATGYIGPTNRNHITSVTHCGGSSSVTYKYQWEYDSLSRPKTCTTKSSSGYTHTYHFEYQQ